jgi:hypothetical protein
MILCALTAHQTPTLRVYTGTSSTAQILVSVPVLSKIFLTDPFWLQKITVDDGTSIL